MKRIEKIEYLQNNHCNRWLISLSEARDTISNQQSMICCCGKLATGLHESRCKRFNNKAISLVLKNLKHLLPCAK